MILVIISLGLISAITGFAQNSDELMERAKTLIEKKDFNAAIQILNDVIKTNPNNGNAYQLRGNAYINLENFQAAYIDFTKALEINPNYILYLRRGGVSHRLGDFEAEIDDYQAAVDLTPDEQMSRDFLKNAVKNLSLKEVGEIFDRRFSKLKGIDELMNKADLNFISVLFTKPEPDDASVCKAIELTQVILNEEKKALKKVLFIKLRDDLTQLQTFTDYINKVEAKITVDENGLQAYKEMHKCK